MSKFRRLLKFERIKLFSSVSFYVVGGCMLSIGASSLVLLCMMDSFLYGNGHGVDSLGYTGIQLSHMVLTTCDFPLLMGILVAIGICTEYSGKTFKNIWSRGFTRAETFFAKILTYALAAIIYSIILVVITFLVGTAVFGPGEVNIYSFLVILVEIVGCIAFSAVFSAVAFLFKKTAVAVVIAVAVPSLINTGVTLLDIYFEYKKIDIHLSDYVLSGQLAKLYSMPTAKNLAISFILSFAYIVTAIVVGYFSMKKDEI